MADNYVTITDIQDAMPDTTFTGAYTADINILCTRASRMIDRLVKKWPGYFKASADSVRYYDGSGEYCQYIDEIAAAPTKVEVAEGGIVDGSSGTGGTYVLWATSDYLMWPYNALGMGQPFIRMDLNPSTGSKGIWYSFPKSVKITGKFGFSTTIPELIAEASVIQVVRWFKRGQQAFRDVGAITELGQLQYVQDLDPDIKIIIANYMDTTI